MCIRATGETDLASFNSVYQNTKSQNVAILNQKNGAFGPLSRKKQYEGTHGHTAGYWRRVEHFNTVLNLSGTGG
jgi:hypothetical protein